MPKKVTRLAEGVVLSFEWTVGSQHVNPAAKFGNSAHVIVPKEWVGQEVLCILKKKGKKQ